MPKILVFAGSTRNDSFNRKLARQAAEAFQRAGLATTLAELRDYPMPMYDGDLETTSGLPERAKAFKELVRGHDILVIASPEYNGSFPALIKNVIDWISRAEAGEKPGAVFRGKSAALLSTSPGSSGGKRGLKHLRELFEYLGIAVLPEQLNVPKSFQAFDSQGKLVRPEDIEALDQIVAKIATEPQPAAA